jgi:MFS family permease
VKRALIALSAGLVLADAAVVTLALPQVLLELDTSVEGVAAVIAVYTGILAIALPVSAALHGRATGAAGALLFAVASIGCASAGSLELLLVMRALQALGGAALLAAAFDALDGGRAGRRLWVGAAVAGTAAGPALGGALTEAFDWRAIFIAQAPIALAAAPALLASPIATVREHLPRPPKDVLAALALALLSGALTALVFLLVLLLISGWSVEPLAAAAAVSVLPLAAVAGSFIRGAPATRAVGGCLLVAGGIACLALLPEASALWTIAPQLLSGVGIGMAFPALAGELLPERTRGQSASLLSLRHAGITLTLIALAPVVAAQLDTQVDLARERGTALVLDAALPPTDKIELAPRLFADIESDDPRDALGAAMERERRRVARQDRDLLSRLDRLEDQLREEGSSDDLLGQIESTLGVDADDLIAQLEGTDLAAALEARLGERSDSRQVRRELTRLEDDLDDVVLAAVDAAFSPAFALTGVLALLAALALLPRLRRRQGTVVLSARRGLQAGALALAALAALSVPAGYAIAENALRAKPVEIADPCQERERRPAGGVEGTIEEAALTAIDRAACKHGAPREKLVLALFDEASSRAYEREYGVKPRSLDAILRSAIGF